MNPTGLSASPSRIAISRPRGLYLVFRTVAIFDASTERARHGFLVIVTRPLVFHS